MKRGSLLAVVAAVGCLGGCARSVFPPGGPIDVTPPRIAALQPADSSVQVPRDAGVDILFSEAMDRTSVRDAIRIYPPAGRQLYDWSGKRLRVTWDKPFSERTTYILLVSGTARDARGVPLGRAATIRFSTGDSLDRGRISGRLRGKTLRRAGVPIVFFPDTLGPRPDTIGVPASYAAETDTGGVYHMAGLPLGRGFTVHAFYDLNSNGSMEPETDLVTSYPEVIRLTPERAEVDSVNLVAVDPRAPALLNGTIATVDSTGRFRVEAIEIADSTLFRRVERVGPGGFTLRVPAGTYRLRAIPIDAPSGAAAGPELRRDDPIEAEPEEEYGPFEFDFGTYRAPKPQTGEAPEDEE